MVMKFILQSQTFRKYLLSPSAVSGQTIFICALESTQDVECTVIGPDRAVDERGVASWPREYSDIVLHPSSIAVWLREVRATRLQDYIGRSASEAVAIWQPLADCPPGFVCPLLEFLPRIMLTASPSQPVVASASRDMIVAHVRRERPPPRAQVWGSWNCSGLQACRRAAATRTAR